MRSAHLILLACLLTGCATFKSHRPDAGECLAYVKVKHHGGMLIIRCSLPK